MNQLKQIFGLSVNITNRVPLRGSSITRSAGTSGKAHQRSRDLLVSASDSDDSPELKISGRSYAKLIADYSKEIEARNVAAKLNGDGKSGDTRAGFFSGTPFQRLARVSSLVKIKTGRNNAGPGLCTKSTSEPPITPAKTGDDSTRGKASLGDKNVPGGVAEHAEWLEKVIKAHKAKSEIANETRSQHGEEGRNMAHPLVQRIAKSTPARRSTSNDFINVENRKITSVKKKTDIPRNDNRNVSVVVIPLKKIDKEKNESPMVDREDKNAMLVRVTEESKCSSTSGSNPLQHIDLRINGKPATELDTVISKVEKLDVVSSAEKIEIRIPVLSEATAGDKSRAPDSTINVYISSQREESPARRESAGEVGRSGDSGSGSSRSGSSRQSTVFIPNVRDFRKNHKFAERSRVVPWWTTEDSFRRSETSRNVPKTSPGPAEELPIAESPENETSALGGIAARGEREAVAAETKEVAVSDLETRVEPSNPRQLSKIRRNGTTAVSKIIANESQKKSDRQRRDEQSTRHRLPLGRSRSDAMPEAESDTGVKSTASNERKKEAPSVAVGSTMPGKSVQPDKSPKKMSPHSGVSVAASGGESRSESSSSMANDTGRDNNLSSANDSRGGIHAKPISEIRAGNAKADTHGVTSSGQVSRVTGTDRVGSKVGTELGTKPLQEVTSESETNEATRPSETYGKIELSRSARSPAEPAKQPKNGRGGSIKPNGSTVYTVEGLSSAKNSTVTMKPIEKKKDGTLIDYGATVTTRKKPERKLSGSRSTNGVQRKKITEQEEPVVVATIKEVIPRRNRDPGGDAFNRNSQEPGSNQNGPDKNRRRANVARDHCGYIRKKFNKISPKGKTNEPNESGITRTPLNREKRNSKVSNESQVVETVTPDKKLLYSVWLRRFKERTGQDPDSTKDPTSRDT